ncbi:MAG TPA: gas vesicle protein GvpG [Archangium sp.]|jgi:hypothetical protein|uniref:gas vesicle protein GvpG n=1 Tax=Archangium sp. TaxID=1872627 RepID=UPI002ED8C3E5
MLLIDDLLLSPVHGLFWIARKLDEAASQDLEKEEEEIKARLRELYVRLEAGQLEEQEFEAQEAELLDRLDVLTAPEEADSFEEEGAEGHE